MQATIKKWGNSLGLRIPSELLREIGLSDGSKVILSKSGNDILVHKDSSKLTLDKLFEGYKEECFPEEVKFDNDIGNEVW
ncbi:MAG: AbrB/MazE/SpoVT family DNA-binding domain-containing protein [Butyrivibrio sp.]|nr:AbrB/MazE/SpoVT family DNA-binding domain-containing protein [Butyrivibrio sp.]